MTDSNSVNYTGYIVLTVGLMASILVCKVIINTVTKTKVKPIHQEMLIVLLFPTLFAMLKISIIQQLVAVLFLLTALLIAAIYSYQVVNRIAHLLKIKILTV